jgi:sodium-dependent dicarboxylate transporter 2/3/5
MLKSFLPFEISDISIGLIGSILLFITPSKQEGEFLLDWNDCKDISWGTLLLFGGGLSIAASLEQSGFIDVIGNYITIISVESLMITLITTIIITMVFTEFISNLALTTILIPVLAVISLKISGSPLTLTLPATIAASTAFILPMSTPPNAVIFSSGYLKVSDIIKSGVFANIISLIIIVIYAKLFII